MFHVSETGEENRTYEMLENRLTYCMKEKEKFESVKYKKNCREGCVTISCEG